MDDPQEQPRTTAKQEVRQAQLPISPHKNRIDVNDRLEKQMNVLFVNWCESFFLNWRDKNT